jgi:hypothetical protein
MRFPLKVGLIFSMFWVILKMTALTFGWGLQDIRFFVFANMLFLTASITIGLYYEKRNNDQTPFLSDVKNGLLAGIPYAVIVSVFLYFYYEKIYPEFNELKLKEIEMRLEEGTTVREIRTSNPEMENKTDAQIKAAVMDNSRTIYSSKFTMILSMLALMIYSTLNAIGVALVLRKVVFRN